MDKSLKSILWQQFGASIDMLEDTIRACPAHLWDNGSNFWYTAYHTLFFLDYYLSDEPEKFLPPQPFSLTELDQEGILPERTYTPTELLDYAAHCREKCRDQIRLLTPEKGEQRFITSWRNFSFTEIYIYNMRHVQHHIGQLNLLLRQSGCEVPPWISQAREK